MAGLLTASTSGGAGAKQHTAETLALWGLIRIFLVAAVWALLRWQSSAWETQADGLDHLVCLPINGTTPHTPTLNGTSLGGVAGLGGFGTNGSRADGGGGKGGGIPSGCIEIGDVAVQSTGAILGMFVFAMLYMGGFSVIATCASENPVSSVSPLGRMAMGYHVLTVAFFASGMVQLKSDAGCATGNDFDHPTVKIPPCTESPTMSARPKQIIRNLSQRDCLPLFFLTRWGFFHRFFHRRFCV